MNDTTPLEEVQPDHREIQRTAQLAKVLGHPIRLSIIMLLAQRTTCFCGDITELFPRAQSTVSQHLKALKEAGLVTCTLQGTHTCYCLNPGGVSGLRASLKALDGLLSDYQPTSCT
ncbi:metalloregulator ArsR/SmtB family transcription factor [Balneolaceae bacterium ANBcel3]|nr:metalloregulator ArsR/SmtB family transcription factor [Balneolaceae bacterium ANBcel3]